MHSGKGIHFDDLERRFRATRGEVRNALVSVSGQEFNRYVPWEHLHPVCEELRRNHANDELIEMAQRLTHSPFKEWSSIRTYRSKLVSSRHRDGSPGRFAGYVGHECVLSVAKEAFPQCGELWFQLDMDDPYFPDERQGICCGKLIDGDGFTSVVTELTIFRFEHLYEFSYTD